MVATTYTWVLDKDVATVVVSVVSLIIAMATFTIGYTQKQIASAKLKLDLYNKRFNIYVVSIEYCQIVMNKSETDVDVLNGKFYPFIVAVRESQYLFEEEDGVYGILQKIQQNMVSIVANHVHLSGIENRDNETDKAMLTASKKSRKEATENLLILEEKLHKYISFKKNTGWRWL